MDFSPAGLGEAVLKMLKVAGWIAAAGAVEALITWIAGAKIDASNYVLVMEVGLANIILVGLQKWLSTKQ